MKIKIIFKYTYVCVCAVCACVYAQLYANEKRCVSWSEVRELLVQKGILRPE